MKTNPQYKNLDQCAKNLSENSGANVTDNTLSVTFEAFANLEKHPAANEVNGVDLKQLYKLLANLMAGYPIDELEDGPTKDFLHKCYSVNDNSVQHFSVIRKFYLNNLNVEYNFYRN